jgi:hypothetical protein
MSWVEDLKPDDDVTVEIIYPLAYIERCRATMKKYTRGIASLLKGAALLGEDETEFMVWDMTLLQVIALEDAMRKFGVEMTHDFGLVEEGDGYSWTYFYADISRLRRILEELDE